MRFLIFVTEFSVDCLHGMIRFREGLHNPMIGNGNRRMAPFIRTFHKRRRICNTVHVAHLRVTMQLHMFCRCIVASSLPEVTDFFDSPYGGNSQVMIEGINRCLSLDL